MKSLNAKKIAAIAATLAMGLAFAGPVSFSNIPIINNAGQPVVQIVVGSKAAASDGVVAGNIAAVIGNLANTVSTITATVNGQSKVSCVVSTPSTTCPLTNQQVWLGEKGIVAATGSYTLQALIGSVLNAGNILNNIGVTKSPTAAGPGYTYDEYSTSDTSFPITSTPLMTSAFAGIGTSVPTGVAAGSNGGGLNFAHFTNGTQDNVVSFSGSQVPSLLSNSGNYSESEYLWLMGFPVFDQATGQLSMLDTNGAYQVVFGKPIPLFTSVSNYKNDFVNHAEFSFLGENWTIFNATAKPLYSPADLPASTSVEGGSSGNFVIGGQLQLAQAITPLKQIFVYEPGVPMSQQVGPTNLTSGPYTVVLQDLSYPNSSGASNAGIAVYKNGAPINPNNYTFSVAPGQTLKVNASGTYLYVYVQTTFPGLYSYEKWAKMQLFSNVVNMTNGKPFMNTTNGNEWIPELRWTTNDTTAPAALTYNGAFTANAALEGIVLYSNQTNSTTLTQGSSFSYIKDPSVWKATYVGTTLGTPGSGNTNYDPLSFSTSTSTGITYSNGNTLVVTPIAWNYNSINALGFIQATSSTVAAINETAIKEPADLFTVTSTLPTAFQITNSEGLPQPSSAVSSVQYNLDSFSFVSNQALDLAGAHNLTSVTNSGSVVVLTPLPSGTPSTTINGNYINSTNAFSVTITGYVPYGSGTTKKTITASFNSISETNYTAGAGVVFLNVTNITASRDLPAPGVQISVSDISPTVTAPNELLLATLSYVGPTLLYKVPQDSYYIAPSTSNSIVGYAGETGNANNVQFTLKPTSLTSNSGRIQYFTYTIPEVTEPSSTALSTTPNANVIIGISNSTSPNFSASPQYWLNYTNGNNNAFTYESTQNNHVKAPVGFITERGSDVGAISTTSATYYMARSVSEMQFLVGPSNVSTTSTTHIYGPYGIGQATNIPNVTIANVSAKCTIAPTGCSVTGLSNLTAVPSQTTAITPVTLNTATNPLVVLDSNANQSATLIVVGSKYVNSVAAQIFNTNPSLNSTFGPSSVIVQAFGNKRILVAGYTANQTVQAGNEFIQDLLSAAGQ